MERRELQVLSNAIDFDSEKRCVCLPEDCKLNHQQRYATGMREKGEMENASAKTKGNSVMKNLRKVMTVGKSVLPCTYVQRNRRYLANDVTMLSLLQLRSALLRQSIPQDSVKDL